MGKLMHEELDYTTLKWVKDEIGESLKQIRQALEMFAEDTSDKTQIRFCVTYLHQIYGTLHMVEIHGAALLAEEMEKLATAIHNGDVVPNDAVFEVLIRGILQLPNYLESLERGQPDLPAVLLPLLNDLRAARNEPLLSESAFFSPDLNVSPPELVRLPDKAIPDIQAYAKKLRPLFQSTLLSWFRDKNSKEHLKKLAKVLNELQNTSRSEQARRLWWVVSGIVEALIDNGLEPGNTIVSLLGQVDKEIKRLIDEGEKAIIDNPPQELIRNCLFYVARASSSGIRVAGLKAAFGLEQLLLKEAALNQVTDDLKGSNAEIMHNVYLILKDDLMAIKDRLDIFVRTGDHKLADLSPLAESLHRTADTLAMLGMADLRKICQDQAGIIQQMISQGNNANETTFMDIASALLYVESTLDNLEINPQTRQRKESDSPDMSGLHATETSQVLIPAIEQEQINYQVIQHARGVLAEVKEAFNQYEVDNNLITELQSTPDKLLQIRGALSIMGLERAASLISSAILFIRNDILSAQQTPGAAKLDILADAITSIEYYLEAIEEGRGPSVAVLNIAEISAEQMGYPVSEADALLNTSLSEPVVETVAMDTGTLASETPLTEAAEKVEAEEIDEDKAEILEIFIEEATEVLDTIADSLQHWRSNAEDKESLGNLRRAYHTIKGSGRLAGAMVMGDFAWAVENMLNRVLEDKLSQSPLMLSLLDHAEITLKGLLAQLKGESSSLPDTTRIIACLNDLADGKQPDISDLGSIQPETITELPDLESEALAEAFSDTADFTEEEEEKPAMPETDPVLVDIFRKETITHLASLRDYLESIQDPETALVTDEVYRALHTLNGSARMANVESITRLSQPMNYLARALYQNKLPFGAEGISTLKDFVAAIDDLLGKFEQPSETLPEYNELEDNIERLRKNAMTMVSQASTLANLSSAMIPAPQSAPESPSVQTTDYTQPAHEEIVAESVDNTQFISVDNSFFEKVRLEQAGVSEEQPAEAQQTEYDTELLDVFLEEAEEIQEHTEQTLQSWTQDHNKTEPVAELQRALHTLKGSARMANVRPIGDLAHAIESLLEGIIERRISARSEHPELLQRCHDWFTQALEKVKNNLSLQPPAELLTALDLAIHPDKASQTVTAFEQPTDLEPESRDETEIAVPEEQFEAIQTSKEKQDSHPDELNEIVEFIEAFSYEAQEEKKETQNVATSGYEQVRVRAELLNELVNYSGEISIYNSRISQQLSAFQFNLTELEQTVNRLREQLRNFEILTETQMMYRHEPTSPDLEDFDPLEMDRFSSIQHLSRGMVESLGDLTSIQNLLGNLSGETFAILSQQEKVTGELQDGLMRTRMVAFASIMPRLRRIVRQTCSETNKNAILSITGGEGELDRSQLSRLIPTLEHILRNAVDHGLESPDKRKAAQKDPAGKITIDFNQQGSGVVIKISDDGSGINIPALREKAVEKGLMAAGADLPDSAVIQFIFASGFSTAQKVTQISGRGVGMDVVNTEIKQLGGTIHVESVAGKGTSFIIRLPLTLLANQALMVQAGEAIYAIQLTNLDHVVRITPAELAGITAKETPLFEYSGHQYHFLNLAELLQGTTTTTAVENERIPLILLRSADNYVAMQVDALLGRQEIVIKSVGPQLSNVSVLSGATILPDGRIALILDIANLVRTFIAQQQGETSTLLPIAAESVSDKEAYNPTVLIVDDSITVRKVTTRLLGRYHYNTLTAKDGLDAIAEMEKQIPDLVLLDVEMPRMDGFELATHMRNDDNLRNVPIIMITSRTGEKHRQHAMEIGVNKYLGKPYQEKELLDSIAELTQSPTEE